MPNKFWTRKSNNYTVVSSAPSVNLTKVGNAVIPIPYPVTEKLGKATATVKNVKLNADTAYVHGSNTTAVKGDGHGKIGGIVSGTVEAKSEPIKSTASPSVTSHQQHIVREGDLQKMQGGNTIGKIICEESVSTATITDDGHIEGNTLPPDLDDQAAEALYQQAQNANKGTGNDRPIQLPRTTKPTAQSLGHGSSGLGAATGSPVILHTGQLFTTYQHHQVQLGGLMPITLAIHYLSDSYYQGIFGHNRYFEYEQYFLKIAQGHYRLFLNNGREFDFKETDNGWVDCGHLGVEVERQGSERFILRYHVQQRTEVYEQTVLTQIHDNNHNGIDLYYNAAGYLSQISNSSGSRLSFRYNAQCCVTHIEDQGGRCWHYTYNAQQHLIAVQPPQGDSETYHYETNQKAAQHQPARLVSIRTHAGSPLLVIDYQDDGRVSRYQQNTQAYQYHYHKAHLVEKIDQNHRSTLYGLDDYGLIKAIRYSDGTLEQEDYDAGARKAVIRRNHGDPITQHFDERQRLIAITNGCCANCGHHVRYEYQGNNPKPIVVIDDERRIDNAYDARDNLLSTQVGEATVAYAYDDRGRMTAHTDAEGHTRQFAYNDQDQLTHITHPGGQTLQRDYDVWHRQTRQIDPLGNVESFDYNSLDQITQHRNALDQRTSFIYNDQQALQALIHPDGQRTEYQFATQQHLIGQTGHGGEEQYHYNDAGQVIRLQRADGSERHFEYSLQGNITHLRNRVPKAGQAHEYYEERITYDYDRDGDLIRAAFKNHCTQLTYDGQRRLVASDQQGFALHYWYTGHTDVQGGLGFLDLTLSYRYNDQQQLKQITRGFEIITQEHNANGDVIRRDYPNQLSEIIEYDANQAIRTIRLEHRQTQTILHAWRYERNANGHITAKYSTPSQEDTQSTRYHYDASGRLIQADEQQFTYDSAGNLLEITTTDQTDSVTQADKKPIRYGKHHQLSANHQYRYFFDPLGRQIAKSPMDGSGIIYYDYNSFDQLASVAICNRQHEAQEEWQFIYDAFNRRIQKTHLHYTETGQVANTVTRHYLYDHANIVAILNEHKTLLATIVHSDEVDTPLSITTYGHEPLPLTDIEQSYFEDLSDIDQQAILAQKKERTYYYHRDHQGSITLLTDANGNIVERFVYDNHYGKILKHEKTQETHNPYAFTGREFDTPDLYYYRTRYYDPTTQRFLTPDPLGFIAGDSNLYRYVENDPVNHRDPSGCNKICKAIALKTNKLYKKSIKSITKAIAKQSAKLGFVGVPFMGWGIAAWSAYEIVQLGLQLEDLYNEYNTLQEPLKNCLAKSKEVKTGKAKESNKVKGEVPEKTEENNVPKNAGPNLNTLEGVTSEINRNADVAVELTRRALERGRITDSAQAFGTRAHKLFEGLNNRLDRRLGDQGSPFSVISEEFRDAAGDVTSRRARGSIGADVKILDTDNSDFIKVLDLKTHGGNKILISPSRQQQFIDRFGAPAEEIFRQL